MSGKRNFRKLAMYATATTLGLALAGPVFAQKSAITEEIVVTARKQQESILKVPVVVTAVPVDKIERLQISDMADLPRIVPGMNLGQAVLSIGTLISIRGVGTSSSDAGVDQSVSLNIDGLSLGQGLAFSSGMFDLGQIEVLKGPQALFFGKSSPGGVVSLRTADPTDKFEAIAKIGYEIEGRETRPELVLSGPLSNTFKVRLAGMYSGGAGYFRNFAVPAPGTGAAKPASTREPQPRNWQVRGTALYDPTDRLRARLKMNYVRDFGIDAETAQLSSCPEGAGQLVVPPGIPFIGGDNCKVDRDLHIIYMDPAQFPQFGGLPNNGVPFVSNRQKFGTLELNYDVSEPLTLTSVTGLYRVDSNSMLNTHHSTNAGPFSVFWNNFYRHDLTQELRLASNYKGPLNFTAGAFYQDAQLRNRVHQAGNAAIGFATTRQDAQTTIDIKTYSIFGQVRYKITPELELAGGARWTDEKRRETVYDFLANAYRSPLRPNLKKSVLSPEATITYTPTDDLTLFAAYKRANKSGSFTVATVVLNGADNSFNDEKVKGYELGVKSRLFDRQMMLNAAFYDYRYAGLQVGATQPVVGGSPIIKTLNAGSARTYGVDVDMAYHPREIHGLGINGSVNWNHGRYLVLNNVPCWGGQTIALGCDQILNAATGRYTSEDLSGFPLIRSPDWQMNFGFDYSWDVGNDMSMVFTNSNLYQTRMLFFLAKGRAANDQYQTPFAKVDLSLALRGPAEKWELAVIGKNVTDKLTCSNGSISNFAGGLVFGGQIQGSTTSGPPGGAGFSEGSCYTERGRSVWLRLTVRPFND
jgi:iron complex outermembrane receptor protein